MIITHPTGYRALVVDDDSIVRQMVMFALSREGFVCDSAANGEYGLARLGERSYDLLVTDLRMPSLNGHALAIDVLERESRPVIIIHTSVNDPRLAKDLLTRGVNDIIHKPADYAAFAFKARSLVERRRKEAASPKHIGDACDEAARSVATEPNAAPVQAKHVVGVLTRSVRRAEEIAETLRSSRIETFVAASSEELYREVSQRRIDALIIEQKLEGFLTGIDLFGRLFEQLIRPKAILLADDDDLHDKADKLGIELIMQPDASPADIQLSVCGLLAKQGELNAFISPAAVQLVQKCGDIPPLPQLLVRLAGYMNMPLFDIPLRELARDISVDAKAASDLMRLTNNSATGLPREITNIFDAVKLHGAKKTISLILGSAVLGIQSDIIRDWDGPVRAWYQKRSVLVASTAATFASRLGSVSPDTAFILGLLQDIGCLVLARRFNHQYQSILARSRSVGQCQLHLIERDDFQMNHAEVSAAVMLKWDLPQSLIRPVIAHHDSDSTEGLSPVEQSLTRVMRIGEALANLSDVAHPFRTAALNRLMAHYGPRRAAECKSAINEAVAKSAELCHVFSLPVPSPAELEQIVSRTLDLHGQETGATVDHRHS